MNRKELADLILKRLSPVLDELKRKFFKQQDPGIASFYVDDLLPADIAGKIHEIFPNKENMVLRNSLRERKYIAAQMDRYDPLLEEAIYAFQDPRVVDLMTQVTGLRGLLPDEYLYAGGISLMSQGNFLNPHLDNSHDKDRKLYRVLNLLYYVSPDWKEEAGGNLELWDQGVKQPPRVIVSRFNRLAVMMTGKHSWHSVNKVLAARPRTCVSNYYFSAHSPEKEDYFHVTSFRGRPEQRMLNVLLRADAFVRKEIRRIFKLGLVKTKHVYEK